MPPANKINQIPIVNADPKETFQVEGVANKFVVQPGLGDNDTRFVNKYQKVNGTSTVYTVPANTELHIATMICIATSAGIGGYAYATVKNVGASPIMSLFGSYLGVNACETIIIPYPVPLILIAGDYIQLVSPAAAFYTTLTVWGFTRVV